MEINNLGADFILGKTLISLLRGTQLLFNTRFQLMKHVRIGQTLSDQTHKPLRSHYLNLILSSFEKFHELNSVIMTNFTNSMLSSIFRQKRDQ